MATEAALAFAHQRIVDGAVNVVAGEVASIARRATVGDIDAWWNGAGGGIRQAIAVGFTQTARLASRWLVESAALAGFELDPVAAALEQAALATSLLIVGPVAFKRQMARSGDEALARQSMTTQLVGAAIRWARAGDRDTLFSTADANPTVLVGYRRQAEAGACPFCQMLAGRGAVYLSQESAGTVVGRGKTPTAHGSRPIGRTFHDHCHCRVVPVYGTGSARAAVRPAPPPAAAAFADQSPRLALSLPQ